MTTQADMVPPSEAHLTNHQIDGIRILRKTLLGSPSYDEVWMTLSMTSDAINLDVPSILLWQDEGQKRRNALFYFIDEGEEGTSFSVCPFFRLVGYLTYLPTTILEPDETRRVGRVAGPDSVNAHTAARMLTN